MKKPSRILAYLLIACLMISLLPISSYAAGTALVPEVSNISIQGDFVVGQTLTATYDFKQSYEGISDQSTLEWIYAWTVDGIPYTASMTTGTSHDFILGTEAAGRSVTLKITPRDGVQWGNEVTYLATQPVKDVYQVINETDAIEKMAEILDRYALPYLKSYDSYFVETYEKLMDKTPVYTALFNQNFTNNMGWIDALRSAAGAQQIAEKTTALDRINNAASTTEIAAAIATYAVTLGLDLSDYNKLSDVQKDAVCAALKERADASDFADSNEVASCFDTAVNEQFGNHAAKAVAAVNAATDVYAVDAAFTKYNVDLGLDLTDYDKLSSENKSSVCSEFLSDQEYTQSDIALIFNNAMSALALDAINTATTSTVKDVLAAFKNTFDLDDTVFNTYLQLKNQTNVNSVLANRPDFKYTSEVCDAFSDAVEKEAAREGSAGDIEIIVAINKAGIDTMGSVLEKYAEKLGLNTGSNLYMWNRYKALNNDEKIAVYTVLKDNTFYNISYVISVFYRAVDEQYKMHVALEAINDAASENELFDSIFFFASKTDLELNNFQRLDKDNQKDVVKVLYNNGTDYSGIEAFKQAFDAAVTGKLQQVALAAVNSAQDVFEMDTYIKQYADVFGIDLWYFYNLNTSGNQNSKVSEGPSFDQATVLQALVNAGDYTSVEAVADDFNKSVAELSVAFDDMAAALIAMAGASEDEIGGLIDAYTYALQLNVSLYNIISNKENVNKAVYNYIQDSQIGMIKELYKAISDLGILDEKVTLESILKIIADHADKFSQPYNDHVVIRAFYEMASNIRYVLQNASYNELSNQVDSYNDMDILAAINNGTAESISSLIPMIAYFVGIDLDDYNTLPAETKTWVMQSLVNQSFGDLSQVGQMFNTSVALAKVNMADILVINNVLHLYEIDLDIIINDLDLLYDNSSVLAALTGKNFADANEFRTAFYNAVQSESQTENSNITSALTHLKQADSLTQMQAFFATTDAHYLGLDQFAAYNSLSEARKPLVLAAYINCVAYADCVRDARDAFTDALKEAALKAVNEADANTISDIIADFAPAIGISDEQLSYLNNLTDKNGVYSALLDAIPLNEDESGNPKRDAFSTVEQIRDTFATELVIAVLNDSNTTAETAEKLLVSYNSYFNYLIQYGGLSLDGKKLVYEQLLNGTYKTVNDIYGGFISAVLTQRHQEMSSSTAISKATTKLKETQLVVKGLVEKQYTVDSWAAFEKAYDAAQNMPETTLDEILAKTTAIETAIDLLKPLYTISIGNAASGGIGYKRTINVTCATSDTLAGKYLLIEVTEGTGATSTVSLTMISADNGTATLSYTSSDAKVLVWLTSGMPANFTGESMDVAVYAAATTAKY